MRAMQGLSVLALLAAGVWTARAADVGGGYFPVLGNGRIRVARAGLPPVRFESNLRLEFEGDPGDSAGTGRLLVYDDEGQILRHQVPFDWTTGKGRAFSLALSGPELGEYIVQRIGEATGASCVIALDRVAAKGTVSRAGEDATLSLRVAAEVSVEGGPMRRLRASVRAR